MEDEPNRLVTLELQLLLDMSLVLAEKLGMELDVSWSIDSVDVTKTSGNREQVCDLAEGIVDIEDILGLGVERGIVNTRVVDTILLASSDTDLHLEVAVDLGHALEVFDADFNVFFLALL